MPNQEFQELKRKWGIEPNNRNSIISEMRYNLKQRNGLDNKYLFRYTNQGVQYDIDTSTFNELCEIDGDMINFE